MHPQTRTFTMKGSQPSKKSNPFSHSPNLVPQTSLPQHSNRPSLIKENSASLSSAAGVSHLTDKRNSGLLLFKNQQSSSASTQKRDNNKVTIDYYSVQNIKQNNPLSGRSNTMVGSKAQTQNSAQKPTNNNNNNQATTANANTITITSSSVAPVIQPIPQQVSIRQSIRTEHRKQRAISSTKHLNQFQSTAATANSLSSRGGFQWKGNNKKLSQHIMNQGNHTPASGNRNSNYINSMVDSNKLSGSPLPFSKATSSNFGAQNKSINKDSSGSNLFRSPQHTSKQQHNVFSNSNSPLPNSSSQVLKTPTHSQQTPNTQQSQQQQQHQKTQSNFSSKQGIIIGQSTTSITSSATQPKSSTRIVNSKAQRGNAHVPSCLQIDLSSLSSRMEDDTNAIQPYGANTQPSNRTTNQAKASSGSSYQKKHSVKKKTPSNKVAQSPIMLNGKQSSTNCKSPITSGRKEASTMSFQKSSTKEMEKKPSSTSIHSQKLTQSQQKKESRKQQHTLIQQSSVSIIGNTIIVNPQPNQQQNVIVRESLEKMDSINGTTNHYLESEENNNIPEIQSFSNTKELPNHDTDQLEDQDQIHQQQQQIQQDEQEQQEDKKVEVTMDQIQQNPDELPLSKERFIELNQSMLYIYEIKELKTTDSLTTVYFQGLQKQRTELELNLYKGINEDKLLKQFDDEEGYYNVAVGDHLMYRYEVIKVLGKGSFAQVVSCIDHKTSQKVAVKITRNTEIDHKFALSEARLLNYLMKNDPSDKHNIVRLNDEFYFRDHHCFVFELLHTDLFEHLKENGFIGFPTGKIREYAIQILDALIFLDQHKIIHCDLKPENILLVDESCNHLKLVDYGSGCFVSEQVYTYVQSRFYRAPEVILRLSYTERVDMWSFGCILAELYTGEPLFPGNNEQEQLELIMELCGIPPAEVIDKSRKKDHYFDVDYSPYLIEDEQLGILRIPESKKLSEVVQCQDQLFLDFIQGCIELDPVKRMSASEAMKHPWIVEGLKSHSPLQQQVAIARNREDDKVQVCEESPVRPIKEKPKKSLSKAFNYQSIKLHGLQDESQEATGGALTEFNMNNNNNNDSFMSNPKSEGGIENEPEKQDMQGEAARFVILEKEAVIDEVEVNKPHIHTLQGNKREQPPTSQQQQQQNINKKKQKENVKMLAQFELVGTEQQECAPKQPVKSPKVEKPNGSGIMQAKVGDQAQTDAINNENTINKITITVYQRRSNQKSTTSQKQQQHK